MEQGVEVTKRFCDQCGEAVTGGSFFCGGCGRGLRPADSHGSTAGLSVELDASGVEQPDGTSSMSLGTAWAAYVGAMMVWLGALMLPNGPVTGPLVGVVHLGFGFVMTRHVMSKLVEFHPLHNTLANVFSTKLWMFLLWPLRMPILLFKLTVSGAL